MYVVVFAFSVARHRLDIFLLGAQYTQQKTITNWDTEMKAIGKVLFVLSTTLLTWMLYDSQGTPETNGEPVAQARPAAWQAAEADRHTVDDSQILFGDFHVHTTFSMDAHGWAMPVFGGEGLHPPSEACDYARFCSGLDFWSFNDHAEGLTPWHWNEIKDTVRACNAVAGDPQNPDLVTYLGWEWTQMGNTRDSHYGHKNVIIKDTADAEVPARPISSGLVAWEAMRNNPLGPLETFFSPYLDFKTRDAQQSLRLKQKNLLTVDVCDPNAHVNELPKDCLEYAETPQGLFRKLNEGGWESLVIPHGNTWGFYTPPGSSWDKQLSTAQHDPKRQTLVEVFSGHGNSEEYRDWRAVSFDEQGNEVCPAPSDGYLPCCHRAGEIIQDRCEDPNSSSCEDKVAKAKLDYLAAGRAGHLTIPDTQPEDWLACGQCTDCYLPALSTRPALSTQYALALRNFEETDENGEPLAFRWGFIASSDNHAAQPGTGYKEIGRHKSTEAAGATTLLTQKNFVEAAKAKGGDPTKSVPFDINKTHYNFLQVNEMERQGSYFYTGGLVAIHSQGRDRDSIWQSLENNQVYGTSGERILLWFNAEKDGQNHPMGSQIRSQQSPSFKVRALGSFQQLPGCPDHSIDALGAERLDYMCGGECYNPSDSRNQIERIEIVRIRPQANPDEAIGDLIDDVWKSFDCSAPQHQWGDGCEVSFKDPEFTGEREFIYYARAIQQEQPIINAGQLRCEFDDNGQCIDVNPCYGGPHLTPREDDCLAPATERAWSSPIYLRPL